MLAAKWIPEPGLPMEPAIVYAHTISQTNQYLETVTKFTMALTNFGISGKA